jgi:hypothetical protein
MGLSGENKMLFLLHQKREKKEEKKEYRFSI